MLIITVKIERPEAINLILGQAHIIKTVEDIHEALVAAVPGIKFGLAFCEASGKCLVRWSGTNEYPQHAEDGARGLPDLLHHGQPHGGRPRRDGPGAGHPGRGRRVPAEGRRG